MSRSPQLKEPMSSQISQEAVTSRKALFDLPFYPALLCAYLPVLLLSPNLAVFDVADSFRAVVFMAVLGLLLQTTVYAITRSWHHAALVAGLFVITVWTLLINRSYGLPGFALTALIIIYIWRHKLAHRATGVMNLFALAVFIQPLTAIAHDYITARNYSNDSFSSSPFQNITLSTPPDNAKPNIVHILLDGYAGSAALKEDFGFDNSQFLQALESKGFVIVSETHTPYNQTLLAMASVFSGSYLTPNQYPLVDAKPDRMRMTLGRTLYEGPLNSRLAELDYSFISAGSGYYFFRPAEDGILLTPQFGLLSLNAFEDFVLQRILSVLPESFTQQLGLAYSRAEKNNAYLRHAISTTEYREQKSPFHYFIHLLAPHPPFVIDREGNTTDRWLNQFGSMRDASDVTLMDPERQAEYSSGYLEKLLYVNNSLLPQLDRLIEEVPSPKIIIIHGDHGSGATFHQTEKTLGCLADRYTPFFAIYSDSPAVTKAFRRVADDRFNLVNIYRLLADSAFGTSMGLLEDKSWFASWDNPQNPVLLDDGEIEADCSRVNTELAVSQNWPGVQDE